MKYYILKSIPAFKKIIINYYLIELLIVIIYSIINNYDYIYLDLILGINTFYDSTILENIVRIINICIIIYSTYEIYFFDLNRSIEFSLLRENKKKYLINHMLIVIFFNILVTLILSLVLVIFFGNIDDVFITKCIKGVINVIYISVLSISIVNLISYKKYLPLFLLIVLMALNLMLIDSIIEIAISVIMFIINVIYYNPHMVYNHYCKK